MSFSKKKDSTKAKANKAFLAKIKSITFAKPGSKCDAGEWEYAGHVIVHGTNCQCHKKQSTDEQSFSA